MKDKIARTLIDRISKELGYEVCRDDETGEYFLAGLKTVGRLYTLEDQLRELKFRVRELDQRLTILEDAARAAKEKLVRRTNKKRS